MEVFVNKFNDDTEETLLAFRLMTDWQVSALSEELYDYLEQLNQDIDDLPLTYNYNAVDGIIWETTPEYDRLMALRSKAQELYNCIQIVIDEL